MTTEPFEQSGSFVPLKAGQYRLWNERLVYVKQASLTRVHGRAWTKEDGWSPIILRRKKLIQDLARSPIADPKKYFTEAHQLLFQGVWRPPIAAWRYEDGAWWVLAPPDMIWKRW